MVKEFGLLNIMLHKQIQLKRAIYGLIFILSLLWVGMLVRQVLTAYTPTSHVLQDRLLQTQFKLKIHPGVKQLFGIDLQHIGVSELDAHVLGIVTDGKKDNAALIQINNQVKWFYVGDNIQANTPIIRITANSVIFKYNHQLEKLTLTKPQIILDKPLIMRNL